jgi:hypothetical protein
VRTDPFTTPSRPLQTPSRLFHVWRKIGELREQFEVLREDRTPIDVFAFLELDLGLDPIPFDDLTAKYRVCPAGGKSVLANLPVCAIMSV